MTERPSLSNGYLWVCNSAMSSSQARHVQEGVGQLRCDLRVRDVGAVGFPAQVGMIVELWVHPDDDRQAQAIVTQALAGA